MKKINILIILLSLNLSLLLGNIIFEYVSKEKPVVPNQTGTVKIDSLFSAELYDNGIKPDWVKHRKTRDKKSFYNVNVPRDLSITSLLRNLNKTLQGNGFKFSTIELVENGKTKFEIFENDKSKSLYYFFYVDSLKREVAELSFLINVSDNENLAAELLNSVVPLTFLIMPSENADSLVKKISETSHDYFISLDDNIKEEKYYLDLSFSKMRLKAVIDNICKAYNNSNYVVLKNNSRLTGSSLFNFIEKEFNKRGKKFTYLNEFKEINGSEVLVKSGFNYYSNNRNEPHKIIIDEFNFVLLKREIGKSLKRGDKYYLMKDLIN